MSLNVFIDVNIPMYSGGAAHPLKYPCIEVLRLVAEHPAAFDTDAEVLQEILHRYIAQQKLKQGIVILREFEELMRDRVSPIASVDILSAASLATSLTPSLAARDLIHLAVMQRLGVTRIVSADRGFDGVPDVERLDPARFEEWRDSVTS